jgi:uncharacterized protein YkwD
MDIAQFLQMEQKAANMVNAFRRKHGKGELKVNVKFCLSAQKHSEHESDLGKMSHDGFSQRAKESGANRENVAMGQNTIEEAVQAWFESEGHRKNILEAQREIGVGHDGKHWTMLLA